MKKNFLWLALASIFSITIINEALAPDIRGQLRNALLEKLSSDPTGSEGRIYFNSTSKKIKIHDGTSWVDIVDLNANLTVPTGTVNPYAGSTAPNGWLIANGSAISRTTYSALFAAIGTTYGVGDGSTTFNLPDLRGRSVSGVDSGVNRLTATGLGAAATLGANGGTETHTLTTAEIPAVASSTHDHRMEHNHQVGYYSNALKETSYLTTNSATAGTFTSGIGTLKTLDSLQSYYYTTGTLRDLYQDAAIGTNATFYSSGVLNPVSGTAITSPSTGTPSATVGSGGAHKNIQPTLVLNYIIKI